MYKPLILLFLLLPFAGFGQLTADSAKAAPLKNISYKLNSYANNHVTEKPYLQFDKPYYAGGDTIYFKAYVTLGGQHKLSALSAVLYVELISPQRKIAASLKLQMLAGIAWGDFALPDTLKGGAYSIRAYTNWMRNEGENSFFEQPISIGTNQFAVRIPEGGDNAASSKKLKSKSSEPNVQFLPEGGSLVNGSYSKVAFKAVGPDGLGVNISGVVTDETGTEVCKFASAHLGMGAFEMVPQAGRTYSAAINYADGAAGVINLPKALSGGYTISLNNMGADTIRIRVTAGEGGSVEKINLVAQSGGTVYYAAEQEATGKFFSAVIPKNKFPTGIVQFTLFSKTGEPLNERLVFINNNDGLKLGVRSARQSYSPRQNVKIDLSANDKGSKAVTGSFSVAVTNETNVPVDSLNENNILSDLLLTSELKGEVEQPAYYFANNDAKSRADMDLLMLTQGYRHFEWKNILDDTISKAKYLPEKAMEISGSVKRNGKPAAGAMVKLFSNTGGMFMLDTLTDVNGKFTFKDLLFADGSKFVIQSRVKKGQDDVVLDIDTARSAYLLNKKISISGTRATRLAEITVYTISAQQFYQEQQKYGINKTSIMLREVTVAERKQPIIPHSENLNGSGSADQVLTAKDIERFVCGRLKDCLQGVLKGIIFTSRGVPTTDGVSPVALYIDGTFVDAEEFDSLHADDIEGIERITGPHWGAIYGTRMAYGGGLLVTTKRARRINNYFRYAPGVVTYKPQGFYKAREFYSPPYDNPHTNQKMADFRSTIYWNPNIITDKDGKASFSFFNADGRGTYRVVVEGIDADGNLGRQVFRYKVE